MEVLDFIMEHALILVPVLNILGLIFKKTEKVPDNWIPLFLLGFGLAGAFFLRRICLVLFQHIA